MKSRSIGTFNASDLFFEKTRGETVLSGDRALNGTGTAAGQSILCLGFGTMHGAISLTGTGTFVGRGFYRAEQTTDNAMFTGTGLIQGDGFCHNGRAAELESAEEAGADTDALIDFGDRIYGDVSASQRAARPFLTPSISSAPNMARAITATNAVNGSIFTVRYSEP